MPSRLPSVSTGSILCGNYYDYHLQPIWTIALWTAIIFAILFILGIFIFGYIISR